jgi:hypothetical protein
MQFLPWYNKELIAFLEPYLTNKMHIFEYGGGNSTLYYSSKVLSVSTTETRKEWFDFVLSNQTIHNIEIKLCQDLVNFQNEITNFKVKLFDVIIVDSIQRAKCLFTAIDFLKKDGIIILDNSERENLKTAKNKMIELGFDETIYQGERNDGTFSTSSIFQI